jgi:hypothetical protein
MELRKKWAEARFKKVTLEREAAQRLLPRDILIPDMVIEPDAAVTPAAPSPPAPTAAASPELSEDEGMQEPYDSRQRHNFERRLFTLIHKSRRFLGLT